MYHIYPFACVEPSLHPRNKSPLILVCDPFNVPWNLVCHCFVENFCVYIHQEYWPVILFSWGVFIWLWYQRNASWALSLAHSWVTHSRGSELSCAKVHVVCNRSGPSPVSLPFRRDHIPRQQLDCSLMRDPEAEVLSYAVPEFLTYKNCDIINAYCFKPLGSGVICYEAMNN